MKSSIQLSPSKHLENISKMFKKLYNDEQLADVTLCCKDGRIKAHKLILATSSPYFHKIFTENHHDHPILIMHGVTYQQLHYLIELMYKGNVDVLPEALNSLYQLAGEFQLSGISGILREEGDKSSDTSFRSEGSHGRDTRFKGLKRVAVDYKDIDGGHENEATPAKKAEGLRENLEFEKKEILHISDEGLSGNSASPDPVSGEDSMVCGAVCEDLPKLSAWAKKLRKFKCDLCPSTFKRSSHLTRHQLVHTGERPFACEHCDKAFSRHDKLKHHIRKTHEQGYETDYSFELPHTSVTQPTVSPLPFIISNVRSEADEDVTPAYPPKRPRGRPRKYPPVQKPLIKRGRGRPRLNPIRQEANGENYDITNLPYGDLEYLTMPLQEPGMMEPYVEIKTDKDEVNEENNKIIAVKESVQDAEKQDPGCSATPGHLKVLESRIAKIGECTISVANH